MRLSCFSVCLVLVGLAGAFSRAAEPKLPPKLPPDCLPVSALKPGLKGVLKTVVQGTKVEEFPLEIVGVMKNAFPRRDMILIRITAPRIVKSGLAAGMSGSPVYVDGKLIGALALGWTFSKEPLAGVTPIANMLESAKPRPRQEPVKAPAASARRRLDQPLALAGTLFDVVGLPEPPPPAAALATRLTPLATPLALSGVCAETIEFLRKDLAPFGMIPIQTGGVAGGAQPQADLVPGAVIGIDLVRGDMRASAMGTVTYRQGDTILAFGHGMTRSGEVSFPISTGQVHVVLPSTFQSLKLTSSLRPVGTLVGDWATAVVGKIGPSPEMITVTCGVVRPDVAQPQAYRFEIVNHPIMTARLIATAALNSVLVNGAFPREHTVRLRLDVDSEPGPPIRIDTHYAAVGGSEALGRTLNTISLLIRQLQANPFGPVKLTKVALQLDVKRGYHAAQLESVRLDRDRLKQEESLQATLTFRPYRGERFTRSIAVTIPKEVPPGKVTITFCDARNSLLLDAREAPHRFQPRDLASVYRLLNTHEDGRDLFVRFSLPGAGLVVDGVEMPSVPPSMLRVLASNRRAGRGASLVRYSHKMKIPTDYVLVGRLQAQVQVEPKED